MNNNFQLKGLLLKFPPQLKKLLLFFVSALIFGFVMGMEIVYETTNFNSKGIEENFLGNEDNEDAETLIFKKSPREIRTMIHNHVLSLSVLFLVFSLLTLMSSLPKNIAYILAIEPFISLFLTFGGVYFLWKGVIFMKYIIFASGVLMSITLIASLLFIIKDLLKK